MSNRDAVLAALTDELPLTNLQLADELNFDARTIADALHELKVDGLAKRLPDGWVRCTPATQDSSLPGDLSGDVTELVIHNDAPTAATAAPPTAGPEQETPMPRPKKTAAKNAAEPTRTKRKYTRRKSVEIRAPAPLLSAGNAALSFALTEDREISIDRRDGTERSTLCAADALRLADFGTSDQRVEGADGRA